MQVSSKAEASKKIKYKSRSGKEISSFGKTSNINQERRQNGIKLMNRFTIFDENNDECRSDPSSISKVGKIRIFQSIDTKNKRKSKKVNSESNQQLLNITENSERVEEFQLVKSTKVFLQ